MTGRICLNRSVLDFMAAAISEQSFVLEFGAGFSSRWFADRCGRLVSIETSSKWAAIARLDLNGSKCDWQVRTSLDMAAAVSDLVAPDLILIDGVESMREKCARLAWPMLKHGGFLVFDDAQRSVHAPVVSWLSQFGRAHRLVWDGRHDVEPARNRLAIAFEKVLGQ